MFQFSPSHLKKLNNLKDSIGKNSKLSMSSEHFVYDINKH